MSDHSPSDLPPPPPAPHPGNQPTTSQKKKSRKPKAKRPQMGEENNISSSTATATATTTVNSATTSGAPRPPVIKREKNKLNPSAKVFVPPVPPQANTSIIPSSVVKNSKSSRKPKKRTAAVSAENSQTEKNEPKSESNDKIPTTSKIVKNRNRNPRPARSENLPSNGVNPTSSSKVDSDLTDPRGSRKGSSKNKKDKIKNYRNTTGCEDDDCKMATVVAEEEGEFCLLCTEVITCAAVTRCNHPICHICALRMRVKTNDKHCPVCKDDSDVVIVYPISQSFPTTDVTFESFNLDVHSLESPLPGVQVLHQAQMLFVNAHKFFVEAQGLLAITCPECQTRCRSDKALHAHVKEKHNMKFCHLCYEHRPLFTSEMRLMSPNQLQAHMKASINPIPEKNRRKKGKKDLLVDEEVAAGHQLCRFCSKYFYDTQDLYVHMRDEHFTCHLCPGGNNHRFYRNLADLLQHLSSSHFLCSLCLNSQMSSATGLTDRGDGVVAFKRQGEYSEHMLSSHNIKSSSSSYSSLSSHIQASFTVQSNSGAPLSSTGAPGYLDLHFSSSDPYNVNADDTHQSRISRPRRSTENQQQSFGNDNFTETPPHEQFPSLRDVSPAETTLSSSRSSAVKKSSSEAHPMSLTSKIAERKRAAAALKEEEERRKELQKAFEVRRELRNSAFADALGLSSKSLMQNVRATSMICGSNSKAEASCTASGICTEVYLSLSRVPIFTELLQCDNPLGLVYLPQNIPRSMDTQIDRLMPILKKPLYSSDLIAWAKNHRMDLIKVEKSIQDLLADDSASSTQLKPMKKWSLDSIHELAKYYGLNSQQYFRDNSKNFPAKEGQPVPPTQYISLIKTIDSTPPAILLSAAALPFTLNAQFHSNDATASHQVELQELLRARENMDVHGTLQSTLYFLINTKKVNVGTTVGDLIFQILDLVKTQRNKFDPPSKVFVDENDRIVELTCIGNGLVKMSLNSFAAAKRLLDIVTAEDLKSSQLESQCQAAANSKLLSHPITDKFYVTAHFTDDDIQHASYMDDIVEEEFRLQLQDKLSLDEIAPNQEKNSASDDETPDSIGDDWNSFTTEQMEKTCQSLEKKKANLESSEVKWQKIASSKAPDHTSFSVASEVSITPSSSRPDVPRRLIMTASVFQRKRLPVLVSTPATVPVVPPTREPPMVIKSKICLHTPSGNTTLKEKDDGCEHKALDSLEAIEFRRAVEESLKDQFMIGTERGDVGNDVASLDKCCESGRDHAERGENGARNQNSFESLSRRRNPDVDVYQAPRGKYFETHSLGPEDGLQDDVKTPLEGQSQGYHNDAQEAVRVPIVVPQQLKQSITYPVRYTYDRRNHRQQVQNSFSILQNGEIDTYYQSDDDCDDGEGDVDNQERELMDGQNSTGSCHT